MKHAKFEDATHRPGVTDSAWTITGSASRVEFTALTPDMINTLDVCRGLGRAPRFTGQTSEFYSVAQHSMFVTALVGQAMPDGTEPHKYWRYMFAALLHDASEAYICDLSSPVKGLLGEPYRKLEKALTKVIFERYEVPMKYKDEIVKDADDLALAVERYHLMPEHPDWPRDEVAGKMYDIVPMAEGRAIKAYSKHLEFLENKLNAYPTP